MEKLRKKGRTRAAAVTAAVLAAAAFASLAATGYAARLVPFSHASPLAVQYPAGKVTICHHTHSAKNPFVTITVFAGLAQVPQELLEAASIDGAKPWSVFREVTMPLLKPIFVILISLSIIWDFQVFQQIWIMLDQRPTSDYYTMAIYAFSQSFRLSEYGLGSAIAVVMVLFMFLATTIYLRQMLRAGEVQ